MLRCSQVIMLKTKICLTILDGSQPPDITQQLTDRETTFQQLLRNMIQINDELLFTILIAELTIEMKRLYNIFVGVGSLIVLPINNFHWHRI